MKHLSQALILTALSGALLSVAIPASAQTTTRWSSVEFKDTTLNDALELIFKAANNPAHNIDPSAALVPIGQVTLQNIAWDSALRTLANQNGFKVSRGTDGIYIVEPRAPINPQGGSEGGSFGSSMRGPGGSMSGPSNPFGAPGAFGGGFRNQSAPQGDLGVSTQVNAQTAPRFGGGSDAGSSTNKKFTPIFVRHVYAGGIALLFQNSSVISTEQFVSPNTGSSNGNSGGGGRGGRGGGGGGSGVGVSGFGGGGGGIGGGGGSSFGGGGGGGGVGVSGFGGGGGGMSGGGGGGGFGF